MEDYQISEEQKQFWKDNGYIIATDILTPEQKEDIVKYAHDLRTWPDQPGKWMNYYERNLKTGEEMLCRTENFTPFHDGLCSIVKGSRLLNFLGDLVGENVVLFKEKINYKLPGGGGFPPHQDAPAYTQFGQKNHITALLAVDPATIANGCLEVVPGDHTLGVLPQEEDGTISRESYCNSKTWVPVLLNRGDVLIFGSYLPHRSGGNTTEGSRIAFYLTYNCSSEGNFRENYYADKRTKFPPKVERKEGVNYAEGAKIYNLATPIVN